MSRSRIECAEKANWRDNSFDDQRVPYCVLEACHAGTETPLPGSVDGQAAFFAPRELILWSLQGVVQLVASQDVLEETQRNIAKNAPEIAEVRSLALDCLLFQ